MGNQGRYPKSPEHRAKLAESTRRYWEWRRANGLPAPNLGVPMPDETRRRMSEGRRGNKNAYRHGMVDTRTHNSWRDMLARVRQPGNPSYSRYGARGITVCDRWLAFENFYADMGERPAGRTLDRIDPDGHYEPGNCRWATPKEQRANHSKTKGGDAQC